MQHLRRDDPLPRGSVIRFAYPLPERGLVTLPCLVLKAETNQGHATIALAPGLDLARGGPDGVPVSEPASLRAAGLHAPTAFRIDMRLIVSTAHPGLRSGPHLLGRITGAALVRLDAIEAVHAAMRARRPRRRRRGSPRAA